MAPSTKLEYKLLNDGYDYIIGVDEVGRGSLAGPVVVCAFVFHKETTVYKGVNDSKQLTRKKREALFKNLSKQQFVLGESSEREIEEINLSNAVTKAILRSLDQLDLKGNIKLLLDGRIYGTFPHESESIIAGDAKHYSIAAASIIAKVHRDTQMREYAKKYPHYGFETNVGYATKYHRDALKIHGVTEIHRRTFKSVLEILEQYSLLPNEDDQQEKDRE